MNLKKRGKAFLINAVFIISVIVALVLIINSSGTITGMQVLDATTAKLKLETALSNNAFFSAITQGSICIAINDPKQPITFQAVKSGTRWTVTEEDSQFCQGETANDLIISFANYGDYSRIIDDPSPRNLINGAISQTYQILPSRYVEQGGNVICDASFKIKFCDALNQAATPEQLIDGDMVCCIDKLSRSQRKLLEEHLTKSGLKDEAGILEQPASGFSMTSLFILIVILVIVGGGAAGFFLFAKKGPNAGKTIPTRQVSTTVEAGTATTVLPNGPPTIGGPGVPIEPVGPTIKQATSQGWDPAQVTQLKQYAKEAIQQGYTPEQLYEHFLEQGWDDTTAREAINEAVQMFTS
jgi:hypothetical protein